MKFTFYMKVNAAIFGQERIKLISFLKIRTMRVQFSELL
jgi:hypothetical protein